MLGYGEWLTGLQRGIAAHHAGMLPTFKEVVEELFEAGLIRAVFATETLALGINMPARTVVIERLDKWNGENHADLTPGEYTQLTGRAGRRGIDVEGHAVVLWQPGVDPLAVAGLAGTRTYPLNSSFRPSYNMAVNLVGQVGRDKAAALLESSFAQFQADRAVVGIARQARRSRAALDELEVACDRGDFAGVPRAAAGAVRAGGRAARARSADRRAQAPAVAGAAAPRRHHPGARRAAGPAWPSSSTPAWRAGARGRQRPRARRQRPAAAGADRWPPGQAAVAGRLPDPGQPIDRLRIPNSFSARSATAPPGPGRQPAQQAGRPGHPDRPGRPRAAAGRRRTTIAQLRAAAAAASRATAARTATRTPGRRSSGPGWSARWPAWRPAWPPGRT